MKLKTGAAVCGVAFGLTGALGVSAAYAAPYVRVPCLVVQDPDPWPGQLDGVMGFDYAPVEHVSVDERSFPVHLADARTNERGHFRTVIRIPEEWRCSDHVVVGTGDTGDRAEAVVHVRGCPHEQFVPGPVFFGDDEDDDDYFGGPDHHGRPAPHHELPGTGGQVAGIALTGGALSTAGLAIIARRRPRSRAT
jgi:LPXTG-motif cell wall-anchored protein